MLLSIPAGKSRLRLSCCSGNQAIFTFDNSEIMELSWETKQVKLIPLAANSPSFLLPTDTFSVDF